MSLPKGIPTSPLPHVQSIKFYVMVYPIFIALPLYLFTHLSNALDSREVANSAWNSFSSDHRSIIIGITVLGFAHWMVQLVATDSRHYAHLDRPDQHIYVDMSGRAVLLAKEGAAGRFNRSMRAFFNFNETLPIVLVYYLTISQFLPKGATVLVTIMAVCRVLYSLLYSASLNARLGPFIMAQLCMNTLTGLMWLLTLKQLNYSFDLLNFIIPNALK